MMPRTTNMSTDNNNNNNNNNNRGSSFLIRKASVSLARAQIHATGRSQSAVLLRSNEDDVMKLNTIALCFYHCCCCWILFNPIVVKYPRAPKRLLCGAKGKHVCLIGDCLPQFWLCLAQGYKLDGSVQSAADVV